MLFPTFFWSILSECMNRRHIVRISIIWHRINLLTALLLSPSLKSVDSRAALNPKSLKSCAVIDVELCCLLIMQWDLSKAKGTIKPRYLRIKLVAHFLRKFTLSSFGFGAKCAGLDRTGHTF